VNGVHLHIAIGLQAGHLLNNIMGEKQIAAHFAASTAVDIRFGVRHFDFPLIFCVASVLLLSLVNLHL
jgi:hypothetical protein